MPASFGNLKSEGPHFTGTTLLWQEKAHMGRQEPEGERGGNLFHTLAFQNHHTGDQAPNTQTSPQEAPEPFLIRSSYQSVPCSHFKPGERSGQGRETSRHGCAALLLILAHTRGSQGNVKERVSLAPRTLLRASQTSQRASEGAKGLGRSLSTGETSGHPKYLSYSECQCIRRWGTARGFSLRAHIPKLG